MTERIDNFTDAAFAFAVSLLVIGGARAPENFDALLLSLGDIPAFAFGFALMAMFWLGHVRWRRLRGNGDFLSTLLTLVLTPVLLAAPKSTAGRIHWLLNVVRKRLGYPVKPAREGIKPVPIAAE